MASENNMHWLLWNTQLMAYSMQAADSYIIITFLIKSLYKPNHYMHGIYENI